MIYPLYTLKRKYKGKKLFIWNINRNSMVLFSKIFLRGIDIEGFVTVEDQYVGEMYMNRPVISVKQIEWKNSILLVTDIVSVDTLSILPRQKVVYWSEALELNEELARRKIIIYGTGYGANKVEKLLAEQGIEVDLYCVTKRGMDVWHRGKKIIEVTEIENYKDYSVIISVVNEKYRIEILESLSGYGNPVFVGHIIEQDVISQINLVQDMDLAVRAHKKIYLYGKRNGINELIEKSLSVYDIKICGYVYETESQEQNIKSIYELALEGTHDKFIFINEISAKRFVKARENIERAGFSIEKRQYVGLQYYTTSNEYLLSKVKSCVDPLVGASILYSQGKPGWKIYGKEEGSGIRVLVLGGSTSSEIYYPENWISKLYYKLKRLNLDVVIYNGAHAGNDIVDEILRLLRDGSVLQPQLVLSMSGLNNITYYKKTVNQFNENSLVQLIQSCINGNEYCSGIRSTESLYDFWRRNIGILKLVANFYGAKFFSFLEPINITKSDKDLWSKSVYELENHIVDVEKFSESVNDEEAYINFMRIFENQDEMYMDRCHYTGAGHEIIATKVYEVILPTIQGMMS